MKKTLLLLASLLALRAEPASATSNYEYGEDEYVTISHGLSPDGKFAITAHGGGEEGYGNFHLFLTNAATGKRIGPLTEVVEVLDTGAEAYAARWSADSQRVEIVYRIDRHELLKVVSYRIARGRAFPLAGPVSASREQTAYWGRYGSGGEPGHERIFGTPKANKAAD